MTANSSLEPATEGKRLSGNLGVASIALMVVATAAPLTVMVAVTPLIMGYGNGAAAPMDAILVGIVMLLFAVGFIAMSKHVNDAGAFYVYITKGLGRVAGLGAASLAVVSYTMLLIALEAYIGFILSETFADQLGIHMPWWLCTIGVVAFVGFLGYRNIDVSTKVLGVALIIEISIIMLMNLSILFSGGTEGMDATPFKLSTFLSGSPGLGILFAVFGFIGFESTAVYREEAKDPTRTIPRATYTAIIFISLLYFVSMWFVVAGVGIDNVVEVASGQGEGMYLDLVTTYLGSVMHDITQVMLITSLFAVVIAIHNVVARYTFILSRYGILFAQLAKVHSSHSSPHISSAFQTFVSLSLLLSAAIVGADPVSQVYAWGAAAGTLGYLFIVAMACMAVITFFYRHSEPTHTFKTVIAPGLGLVGLLGFLFAAIDNLPALTGSGEDSNIVNVTIIVLLAVAFLTGIVGAFFMKAKSHKRFEAILDRI